MISFSDLVGKTILIGLTYYAADNEFIEQKQYWGTVVESNEKRILVKLKDGEIFGLPPDLSSTKIAPPGEYRLRSTGEVVVDPDYLTTWNINREIKERKPMEQLKQEMLEHGLGGLFEALSPYAKNAVYMELQEKKCAIGDSKMGGEPDLPAGIQWPRTRDGVALSFIAQINFSEVHPFDLDGRLPERGMLWFFYDCSDEGMPWGFDPEDADGWKVIYAENAELEPTEAPEDLEVSFEEALVAFESRVDLPNTDSDLCDGLDLPDEEIDDYYDWQEEREGSCNKLLGHSDNIQSGMEMECEMVTGGIYCGDPSGYEKARALGLDKKAARWNLLMQVESNEELGMMWGDLGRLYLWITDEDLKARRFENTWLILQCG